MEGISTRSEFFKKLRWPLFRVNIKKSIYQTYNYFTSYPLSYPRQHEFFTYTIPLLSLFYFLDAINPPLPSASPPSLKILPSPLILPHPYPNFFVVICHHCCEGK